LQSQLIINLFLSLQNIVAQLVSGTRPIVSIGQLNSCRILLITGPVNNSYVFETDLEQDRLYLQGAMSIKDKWPQLSVFSSLNPKTLILLARNKKNEFLFIIDTSKAEAFIYKLDEDSPMEKVGFKV